MLGVEVRARNRADRSGDGSREIGQYVPEQVRRDDDVVALRVQDEARGERVDELAAQREVRVLADDLADDLVPEGHRVDDAVALGRRRHVSSASPRQIGGEPGGPLDPVSGEDALLDRHLLGESAVDATADLRVLAFVVLAHDHQVDLGIVAQDGRHSRQRHHGTQVDVLLELAADRDQQSPERLGVGDVGDSDGPEEDRVVPSQHLKAIRGKHAAVPPEVLGAPFEVVPLEREAVHGGDRVDARDPGRHHLLADAVTCDDGDAVRAHDTTAASSRTATAMTWTPCSSNMRTWSAVTPSSITIVSIVSQSQILSMAAISNFDESASKFDIAAMLR